MEEDQICLYPHFSETVKDFLKVSPVCEAGAVHIPFPVRIFLKRIELGFIVVVVVVLREDAVAHLVKRRCGKRVKRLLDQFFRLVGEGINRCTKRQIFCAVLINKMSAFCLNHAVCSFGYGAVFFTGRVDNAGYCPRIMSFLLRKKTDFVSTISIIKSFYIPCLIPATEFCLNICKCLRAFRFRTGERQFKCLIAFHRVTSLFWQSYLYSMMIS